ncbi:diacylglycerol kinase family protein [Pedobacter ureilyticus]|uniref:Diacylglycerol kinase family protein n=1 Tax=Pedobacter ureilyticus TaxID=1393051 RepID=A0ABW9J5G1_9SPHI|nr:diacylglycerol kinase family protein [Pedobacter helvus]
MRRFLKSFIFAAKGLVFAFQTQLNLRLHLIAALSVLLLGWYAGLSAVEWTVILLCIALVVALELVNTAIEVLVDLVSPEWNHKAGIVKDVAAASVLVAAVIALIVSIVIFAPKIFVNAV